MRRADPGEYRSPHEGLVCPVQDKAQDHKSVLPVVADALRRISEPGTAAPRKTAVFPIGSVPADTETRRRLMPGYGDPSGEDAEWVQKLNQPDRRFYSSPDGLSPKLKAFARERGLVPGESESSRVRD